MHQFSKETGIDTKVKQEIRRALKYNTNQTGTVWSDKHSLFKELPKKLRYEVATTIYNGKAYRMPFFRDSDPQFVISVVPKLRPYH